MIERVDFDDFVRLLQENLSPTSPIQSEEHLFGRTQQLQKIEQAMYAHGRSIFIYGDRGVGKTSLAQTVAYSRQSSSRNPVLLACTPDETFTSLMASALGQLRDPSSPISVSGKLSLGVLELNANQKMDRCDETQRDANVNSCISALLKLEENSQTQVNVVVIDEFDRIVSDPERDRFSDFIKQVGDRAVRTKFIFCGVSDSIQRLIGAHESCYRYLDEIKLERLGWESRFEIIDKASHALGITVDEKPRLRIAAISDGFPHYIHRICEKLFWEMYNDAAVRTSPSADNYQGAIAASVSGIEHHLKQTYDKAVLKRVPGLKEVLWAIADHSTLVRSTDEIVASYRQLFGNRKNLHQNGGMDRKDIAARLTKLKTPAHGSIVTSKRRGWYEFRENIMRGYVRLLAEQDGIELEQEYPGVTALTKAKRL